MIVFSLVVGGLCFISVIATVACAAPTEIILFRYQYVKGRFPTPGYRIYSCSLGPTLHRYLSSVLRFFAANFVDAAKNWDSRLLTGNLKWMADTMQHHSYWSPVPTSWLGGWQNSPVEVSLPLSYSHLLWCLALWPTAFPSLHFLTYFYRNMWEMQHIKFSFLESVFFGTSSWPLGSWEAAVWNQSRLDSS